MLSFWENGTSPSWFEHGRVSRRICMLAVSRAAKFPSVTVDYDTGAAWDRTALSVMDKRLEDLQVGNGDLDEDEGKNDFSDRPNTVCGEGCLLSRDGGTGGFNEERLTLLVDCDQKSGCEWSRPRLCCWSALHLITLLARFLWTL
jgi:hypothetical protein